MRNQDPLCGARSIKGFVHETVQNECHTQNPRDGKPKEVLRPQQIQQEKQNPHTELQN
jgi:hypothetical protein